MFIDISPLRRHRDFRLLFVGQLVSFLGSMVSYMAVPYQVYQLTKSNALVGALGIAQLLPVLLFGLLGGAYADRLDRRRLMLSCEAAMALVVGALLLNSLAPNPSLLVIFVLAALLQAIGAFHSPAMEALTQKLVEPAEYAAAGALGAFRGSAGAIAGPLLGGVLIAGFGLTGAYLFDLLSFTAALVCIAVMSRVPSPKAEAHAALVDAAIGVRFALSKPELVGTYLIDIAATLFAFPVALFPALSLQWGDARMTGLLFSSMAIGSLIATVFSGWSSKVHRQGRVVVIAAVAWGLFIAGAGLTPTPWLIVFFLILAGAADMVSGLFRGIIWNYAVPNSMRGRLAGIAMISYMSGPLLGNARAGWVASLSTVSFSLWSGGVACMVAVIATSLALPKFWAYRADLAAPAALLTTGQLE